MLPFAELISIGGSADVPICIEPLQIERAGLSVAQAERIRWVLKAALVCMVRHLRRELCYQRLAEFNLLPA
jgi:hypothetical protein